MTKFNKKRIFLFLYFFCVIAAFWTLKPLRTSGVIKAFGPDYYPLIKQGVILLIPFVVVFYSMMTCFLTRPRLVYLFTSIFLVANLTLWVLFRMVPSDVLRIVFFYYLDIYITVMVTLFWTYMNDTFDSGEAKRHYGFIGAGGISGGLLGSSISGWMSGWLGDNILLVAAIFMIVIIGIVRVLENLGRDDQPKPVCEEKGESPMRVLSEGVRTVWSSRYLLVIVAIVGIYEVVSTIVDYQFNASSSAAFAARDAMAGFHGKVFFFAQLVSLAVQLFVTSPVHRRFGVLAGLVILPIALLTGTVAFLIVPTLWVITLTIGGEASFAYSMKRL